MNLTWSQTPEAGFLVTRLILFLLGYSSLARKGQEAVDTLVRGAHQVLGGDKFVRLYEKSGSYATAVKEFKSLNPAGVTRLSVSTDKSSRETN